MIGEARPDESNHPSTHQTGHDTIKDELQEGIYRSHGHMSTVPLCDVDLLSSDPERSSVESRNNGVVSFHHMMSVWDGESNVSHDWPRVYCLEDPDNLKLDL